MALRTKDEWVAFFKNAGIPDTESDTYATTFEQNRITGELLPELTEQFLDKLKIDIVGDVMAILRHAKSKTLTASNTPQQPSFVKPPSAKLPQLHSDMTHPQFRKFKIDWDVFKNITHISNEQLHSQLYSCCDESVQNAIINTSVNFFEIPESEALTIIEAIVTKKSNPSVHRMAFSAIIQQPNESIQNYVIRIKSAALECEFECPSCHFDMSSINIKDQLIRGLHNDILQTDTLAKADHLKTLTQVIKHAESFEAALRDQSKFHSSSEVMAARSSEYQRMKKTIPSESHPNDNRNRDNHSHNQDHDNRNRTYDNRKAPPRLCYSCGNSNHGPNRRKFCPAWGKICQHCNIPNHFASVCRKNSDKSESANALIAHVTYDAAKHTYTSASNNLVDEIPATLTPLSNAPQHQNIPTEMDIFPDSGASICLAGPQHLRKLGIDERNLIQCTKQVTAVGGSKLTCHGYIPVLFEIGQHSTKQRLYICDNIDRIYFGKKGYIETEIISTSFHTQ